MLHSLLHHVDQFLERRGILGCISCRRKTQIEWPAPKVKTFGVKNFQEGLDLILGGLKALLRHGTRATRTLGTAVLSLCWVASGRANAYYTGEVGRMALGLGNDIPNVMVDVKVDVKVAVFNTFHILKNHIFGVHTDTVNVTVSPIGISLST